MDREEPFSHHYDLIVDVIEACDLVPVDVVGNTHPYCTVLLKDYEPFNTIVVKKSLTPRWGECFKFMKVEHDDPDLALDVIVYDWRSFGSNSFMGQVSVPVSALLGTKYIDQWYPLYGKDNKPSKKVKGKIHLRISLSIPKLRKNTISAARLGASAPINLMNSTIITFDDVTSKDVLSGMDKKEIKRQQVIFELINTEEKYVEDLRYLMEVYYEPLRRNFLKEKIGVVFSNLDSIVPVHVQLLIALQALRGEGSTITNGIAKPFAEMANMFKIYAHYCANQSSAISKLAAFAESDDTLAEFLRTARDKPESKGLDLGSFIIKPLQRLCKYPLLLKELLKRTPTSHPEYSELNEVYLQISKTVDMINERVRKEENARKLLEIQEQLGTIMVDEQEVALLNSTRKLIKEGDADMSSDSFFKSMTDVHLFLFNDLLIIAKSKAFEGFVDVKITVKKGFHTSTRSKYSPHAVIRLDELLINECTDSDSHMELIHEKTHIYHMAFPNPKDKSDWLKELRSAIIVSNPSKIFIVTGRNTNICSSSSGSSEAAQLLEFEIEVKESAQSMILQMRQEIEQLQSKSQELEKMEKKYKKLKKRASNYKHERNKLSIIQSASSTNLSQTMKEDKFETRSETNEHSKEHVKIEHIKIEHIKIDPKEHIKIDPKEHIKMDMKDIISRKEKFKLRGNSMAVVSATNLMKGLKMSSKGSIEHDGEVGPIAGSPGSSPPKISIRESSRIFALE